MINVPESLKVTPTETSQEALYFTGQVFSELDHEQEACLSTDKQDLLTIIEIIESRLAAKGMNLRTNGVYVNL